MSNRAILEPDFEDMFKAARKIAEYSARVGLLDLQIKLAESDVVKAVLADKQYYVGGKPPSMELIKTTWKMTGINNELIPMREELLRLESELENLKLAFQVMRDIVSTYITDSANKRASNL